MKHLKIIFIFFISLNLSFANFIFQNGDKKAWCSYSAKDLKLYYKFSHIINLKDGEVMQYCSLGELAFESMKEDVLFSTLKAIDYASQKLIDAESAFYLINSNKIYELAFEQKSDALNFQAKFGGEVTDFDSAFESGFFRVEENLEKLKFKNEKKFYPMGKRAYEKLCSSIEKRDYRFINELKADIFKKCDMMDESKADLITNFIWNDKGGNKLKIEVSHEHKCPVCGMFVHKYPRWVANIFYGENDYYAFDGVKDMMKFILDRDRYVDKNLEFKEILVMDYYTQNAVNAKTAFYVVGSDVLGPMGNELIPFEKKSDAKSFKLEHGGSDIYKFDEITKSIVCALDGKVCE